MNLDNLNVTELTEQETRYISGGESGWYWIAYYARMFADKYLAPAYTNTPAMG